MSLPIMYQNKQTMFDRSNRHFDLVETLLLKKSFLFLLINPSLRYKHILSNIVWVQETLIITPIDSLFLSIIQSMLILQPELHLFPKDIQPGPRYKYILANNVWGQEPCVFHNLQWRKYICHQPTWQYPPDSVVLVVLCLKVWVF